MAGEAYIRSARERDADALARDIRPVEADEIMAAEGREPREAILSALDWSSESWAVFVDGDLICLWGVVPTSQSYLGGRVGIVWMLTTTSIERNAKAFWKACRDVLPRLLSRWDLLFNAIDCRHTKAIRWAKRLGFKLSVPMPSGPLGKDFCHFTVRLEDLWVQQQSR